MKIVKKIGMLTMMVSLVACTSTVGNNVVSDEGAYTNEKLDWPALEDASLPEGIFPNSENLAKIGPGVTKKDLYYLLERPHFQETNGAREWNYILKFRQQDGSVKVCQYKALFDEDQVAQNFYWLPEDCMIKKGMTLSTDATFTFDHGGIGDIKPAGKEKLDKFAAYVVANGNQTNMVVIGYTDRLGEDEYNLLLSEQRAQSVKQYLIDKGVSASNLNAVGYGEASPVVSCRGTDKKALISCLAPNRRVEIRVE